MPLTTAPALARRLLLGCAFLLIAAAAHAQSAPRERILFTSDWRFTKDDPAGTGDTFTYANVREWILPTGNEHATFSVSPPKRPSGNLAANVAYTQPAFDDSGWRKLNLPHDWAIEGPFSQDIPGETGKLPWMGVGWYRKQFDLPAADEGRRVYLDVDGAMSRSLVWCNGEFVGGWPYGYASWRVDLTPYLKPGAKNVLAIRLQNLPDASRWYPGAGIYRHVWLVKTSPVHVAHWGTFVRTPSVTAESASVEVQVTVQNHTPPTPPPAAGTTAPAGKPVQVATEIYELDVEGKRVGAAVATAAPTRSVALTNQRQVNFGQTLLVPNPKRWSIKTPHRYVAVTRVTFDGKTTDEYETPFGIRTIAFVPDRGFLLNGEHIPLRGVCQHHDLGALGAAINVRALERQLEILREMGCNAIRTSHNPPAPELLDLCDRMGFVVMDEAFDMWASPKKPNDYSTLFPDWHDKDLRALIRRDRNHPSVILWSMGNEVREQGEPEGWKVAKHLTAISHSEDPTRLTVTGNNNVATGFNGFQFGLDMIGYNYATRNPPDSYGRFHTTFPHIPILAAETSSAVSSRGEYFFPVTDNKLEGRADFQISSYDLYAPRWALPPDAEFKALDDYPFLAGEFVWTGFDYLGEPTPYNADSTNLLNFTDPAQRERVAKELADLKKIRVPSRSSYFGIIDLAGFPKDRYYIYQARWRPELPMAHLLPHWTWPERVGEVTPVHVYTSGDEAEVFVNGKSLGRKKRGPRDYRLRWDDAVYAPGELKVVAYKGGQKWAEDIQRTTGAATQLTLKADRSDVKADGVDLSFVTITVADANGLLVPRSKNQIRFEVSGAGELLAVDNGDATSFESFQATERKAYNGLALAIIRTKRGEAGTIHLRAHSDGLTSGAIQIQSK